MENGRVKLLLPWHSHYLVILRLELDSIMIKSIQVSSDSHESTTAIIHLEIAKYIFVHNKWLIIVLWEDTQIVGEARSSRKPKTED